MMGLRFVLLYVLTLLAAIASIGVVVRMRYRSKSESLLAVFLVWNTLILAPIHVLGWMNVLWPSTLAIVCAFFFGAVLAASFIGTDRRRHRDEIVRSMRDCAQLPVRAISECVRARSLVTIGVVAALGMILWTAWQTYLFPSDGWDAIWYHDTMVGYAIQNHGYAPMDLPMNLTQQANGYPRNCEMTSLWFVIFTDRRLIELPSVMMAIPLVLATYVLARRVTDDKIAAVGFGCAILTVPGVALELRTTYIDLQVGAYLIGALAFCTRPGMRLRDGWMAGVALALLIGGKSIALAWVPVLAVALAIRMFVAQHKRPLATFGTLLGAAALICAMASVTYYRNWINFHNPIWPVAVDNDKWNIHWSGVQTLAETDVNRPVLEVYKAMITPPQPGHDYADTRVYGYGVAAPLVLFPLALLAMPLVVVRGLRWVLDRALGANDPNARRAAWVLAMALIVFAMSVKTPALWSARYNIQIVVGLMLVAAWIGSESNARFATELASVVLVLNLISVYWLDPPIGAIGIDGTIAQAKRRPIDRVANPATGWSMEPKVALAREGLRPGEIVVYGDRITFPSVLWNETFSNRIQYVPSGDAESTAQKLDAMNAAWVVAMPGDYLHAAIAKHPDRWEELGKASLGYPNTAWRRRR